MEKNNTTKNTELHVGSNPNKEYSLMYIGTEGRNMITEMGEEILTDGEIKSMIHNYKEDSKKDYVYKSGNLVIEVRDASYVIIQRLMDNNVDFSHVFTCIEEEALLDEILNLASVKNTDKSNLLTAKQPYVRKISL